MGASTQTVIIIVVAVVALVLALAIAFYFRWVRPRGNKSRVHVKVAPWEPHPVINTAMNGRSSGSAETELMSSGGMSGGAGERGSSEMGATAHAEGSMGSALEDKPAGCHVRTAWEPHPVINTAMNGRSNRPAETELMSSGGMSGGAGERGSSEMGATVSALEDKPAGYRVRTAWT
jgi:hypothetical protein